MNATIRNVKTFETRRGIAWSADIVTESGDIIKADNGGDGGCTFFRGDKAMLASLNEWAKRALPFDAEALDTIVCYTEENETLLQGLKKFLDEYNKPS